eukprot:1107857-Alexandrium_andersonii.AAC.1
MRRAAAARPSAGSRQGAEKEGLDKPATADISEVRPRRPQKQRLGTEHKTEAQCKVQSAPVYKGRRQKEGTETATTQ